MCIQCWAKAGYFEVQQSSAHTMVETPAQTMVETPAHRQPDGTANMFRDSSSRPEVKRGQQLCEARLQRLQ